MSDATVELRDGMLITRANRGCNFDAFVRSVKSTLGRSYDKASKSWPVPATPMCAFQLVGNLSKLARGWDSQRKPEILALVAQMEATARVIRGEQVSALPKSVHEPMPHQRLGASLIIESAGSYLAWDMGTGKTKSVIDAIVHAQMRHVLIACPKSVIGHWGTEWVKHGSGDRRVVLLGRRKRTGGQISIAERAKLLNQALDLPEPVLAVVNYEAVWRDELAAVVMAHGERHGWDLVVCDEAHRIKDPRGKASNFFNGLRPFARRRVGLSGTPIPSQPIDLFAQMRFIDPGIFGVGITEFKRLYCIEGPHHEIVNYRNLDELRKRFHLVAHRVKKEEVLDLPELHDHVITVELGEEAQKLYDRMKSNFVSEWNGKPITITNVLVELLRLQQVTSGAVRFDEDESATTVDTAKEDALEDLLGGIDRAEAVIVFCMFRHELAIIHRVCERLGRTSCELSGKRDELAEWQRPDEIDPQDLSERYGGVVPTVLAAQIQSGGEGVDGQRACYNVWLSTGFSYGKVSQSRSRSYRKGQERQCFYYTIVAENTVDQMVQKVLSKKGSRADQIVNDEEFVFDVVKELLG